MSGRRWLLTLAVLAIAVCAGGLADRTPVVPAQTGEDREEDDPTCPIGGPHCEVPLQITLEGVHAANGDDYVDPQLKRFSKQFAFTNYTHFEHVLRQDLWLCDGDHARVAHLGKAFRVDVLHHDEDAVRVRFRLYKARGSKVLDTKVSVYRNRTFMIAGPRVGAEGEDVLIIPITARW